MSKNADIVLAVKKVHKELFPHSPSEPEISPEHVALVELNRREMAEMERRVALRHRRFDQE